MVRFVLMFVLVLMLHKLHSEKRRRKREKTFPPSVIKNEFKIVLTFYVRCIRG